MQYDALNGATAIRGLTDDGAYFVIKVTDYQVQLANAWAQVSGLVFARNGTGDTITRPSGSWAAAGFAPGQTITISGTFFGGNDRTLTILSLPAANVIKVVEQNVVTAVTETSNVTVTTGALPLANAWAQVPDLVFARNGTGDTITRPSGSWADAGFAAGQTIKISGTLFGLNDRTLTIQSLPPERDQGRRAERRHEPDRPLERHGDDLAHTGEAVEPRERHRAHAHAVDERPIVGLVDGQTYYVQLDSLDPTHKFTLASSTNGPAITLGVSGLNATHKIGTEGVDLGATITFSPTATIASSVLTFTGHGFTENQKVTYDASGTVISGLNDNQAYYVRLVSVSPTTTKFRLASAPNGLALTLDPTGTTGLHALRTEGVDLGTATDSFALVLDLEPGSSASNTNDLLEGPGGADLTQLLSLGDDGVSSSDARGASGALRPSVRCRWRTSRCSPTAKACIGWSATSTCGGTASGATPTKVTAGGAVKVEASATVDTKVYADARAGGIIQVGVARGRAPWPESSTPRSATVATSPPVATCRSPRRTPPISTSRSSSPAAA